MALSDAAMFDNAATSGRHFAYPPVSRGFEVNQRIAMAQSNPTCHAACRRSRSSRAHHRQPDPAQDPRPDHGRRRGVSHQADHDRPGPHRSQLRPGRSAGRQRPRRWPKFWRKLPITAPCRLRCRTARWSRPTLTGHFPRASTARPTSAPKCALEGHWIEVADQEMDCGIVGRSQRRSTARCVPMTDVAARHAIRRRPRRRARVSRRAQDGAASVRVHEQQPSRPKSPRGRHSPNRQGNVPHTREPAAKRCWSAARPSCTPAADRTSAS